jgi:hypothetical protein
MKEVNGVLSSRASTVCKRCEAGSNMHRDYQVPISTRIYVQLGDHELASGD